MPRARRLARVSTTYLREEDKGEVEYTISADVSPFVPGQLSGPPENCYPDEGGECEDIEVTLDGRPVALECFSCSDIESMCERLTQAAQDEEDGRRGESADAQIDLDEED